MPATCVSRPGHGQSARTGRNWLLANSQLVCKPLVLLISRAANLRDDRISTPPSLQSKLCGKMSPPSSLAAAAHVDVHLFARVKCNAPIRLNAGEGLLANSWRQPTTNRLIYCNAQLACQTLVANFKLTFFPTHFYLF